MQNYIISDALMQKDYNVSHDYMKMLQYACMGKAYDDIASGHDSGLVNIAILHRHLLKKDIMWAYSNITQASIEINAECNWRCRFCPNHTSPYAKKHMDNSLFVEILNKIDAYGKIKDLSLNFYGEPLLDNHLCEKLEHILDTQLNLVLYTNGSLIDETLIDAIKLFGSRVMICLNIPSIDEEEFAKLTGYKHLNKVINNLERLLQNNINVQISVNGKKGNRERNIKTINARFPSISIKGTDTTDRAGAVTNEFFQDITIKNKRLFGCQPILHDLQIDVEGNVMICCQDFHKRHLMDNVQNYDDLNQLLKSESVRRYRQMIWGAADVYQDIVCNRCIVMRDNQASAKLLLNQNIRGVGYGEDISNCSYI